MRPMKPRKRKLSATQQKLFDQMIAVIPATIARLETPAQAELLESHIYKMRTGGLINDQEYNSYLSQIKEVYKENQWPMATT